MSLKKYNKSKENSKKSKRKRKMQKSSKDIFLFPHTVKKVVSSLTQSIGWGVKQLRVPDTWTVTRGQGIKVMVIDTGYTDHPDLQGAIEISECKSFLRYEPSITDLNGHSTHVCGIIGARDNQAGMVGVAPESNIITVKVLGEDGSGDFEAIRKALRYAKDVKPDVINMSLGSTAYDNEMHKIIKELHDMNIPIVAAAGNDGMGNAVNYPGKYPEVICVTAFDKNGNPARFNSTGPETDFSAPGVDIYSTWLNKEYANLSGTSMATPFMAGVVALLLAKHRKQEIETGKNDCKTVDEIKQHLTKYADDKGLIGKDDTWGYGVVDIVKVITTENNNTVPDVQDPVPTPVEPIIPPEPIKQEPKKGWLEQLFKKLFGWLLK